MSDSLMKLSGWFCELDQPIYWTELTFMSFDNVWSLKTVVPIDGTCMEKSFIQYSSFRLNKKKDKILNDMRISTWWQKHAYCTLHTHTNDKVDNHMKCVTICVQV